MRLQSWTILDNRTNSPFSKKDSQTGYLTFVPRIVNRTNIPFKNSKRGKGEIGQIPKGTYPE